MVRRQSGAQELLDGPLDVAKLAGNLDDLERFNRHGGELSWALLYRLEIAADTVSLLDVGTGGADIPRDLLRRAEAARLPLQVTATDLRPEIVDIARARSTECPGLDIRLAREGALDFADGAFEVVHSSLLLHHLDPPAAVAMLGEMRRVARVGVIVNDLDRRWLWWVTARLLGAFATRNEYTRNDAPLSVVRAYRPDELAAIARAAGLREIARDWARPPYRYGLAFVPA
jgi:ubiquinone/menaquinone biosynthesis C-methylase UbiE